MYDTYKHIILRDGSFTAGYKHFHMHHNLAQDRQVLFTRYVARGIFEIYPKHVHITPALKNQKMKCNISVNIILYS